MRLSASGERFVVGGNYPCLKNYIAERKFIFDRIELQKQIQILFINDKFETSKRMQYSYVYIAHDEGEVVLAMRSKSVANVLS